MKSITRNIFCYAYYIIVSKWFMDTENIIFSTRECDNWRKVIIKEWLCYFKMTIYETILVYSIILSTNMKLLMNTDEILNIVYKILYQKNIYWWILLQLFIQLILYYTYIIINYLFHNNIRRIVQVSIRTKVLITTQTKV